MGIWGWTAVLDHQSEGDGGFEKRQMGFSIKCICKVWSMDGWHGERLQYEYRTKTAPGGALLP
jgi:hypothetical protein